MDRRTTLHSQRFFSHCILLYAYPMDVLGQALNFRTTLKHYESSQLSLRTVTRPKHRIIWKTEKILKKRLVKKTSQWNYFCRIDNEYRIVLYLWLTKNTY